MLGTVEEPAVAASIYLVLFSKRIKCDSMCVFPTEEVNSWEKSCDKTIILRLEFQPNVHRLRSIVASLVFRLIAFFLSTTQANTHKEIRPSNLCLAINARHSHTHTHALARSHQYLNTHTFTYIDRTAYSIIATELWIMSDARRLHSCLCSCVRVCVHVLLHSPALFLLHHFVFIIRCRSNYMSTLRFSIACVYGTKRSHYLCAVVQIVRVFILALHFFFLFYFDSANV